MVFPTEVSERPKVTDIYLNIWTELITILVTVADKSSAVRAMKIISANIMATHRVEECIHAWMNAHEHNLEENSNRYVEKGR